MAADPNTIKHIQDLLKPHFPDSLVDVTPSGIRDNIHIKVISRRFDGMKDQQREEFLWDLIDSSDLSREDKLCISLLLPLSPDDL